MPFAVELYFDAQTDEAVRRLWEALGKRGLNTRGEDASHPHVSLVVSDGHQPEQLRECLPTSIGRCCRRALRRDRLLRRPRRALPSQPPILELQQQTHSMSVRDPGQVRPFYRPGSWMPHCTLAMPITPTSFPRPGGHRRRYGRFERRHRAGHVEPPATTSHGSWSSTVSRPPTRRSASSTSETALRHNAPARSSHRPPAGSPRQGPVRVVGAGDPITRTGRDDSDSSSAPVQERNPSCGRAGRVDERRISQLATVQAWAGDGGPGRTGPRATRGAVRACGPLEQGGAGRARGLGATDRRAPRAEHHGGGASLAAGVGQP